MRRRLLLPFCFFFFFPLFATPSMLNHRRQPPFRRDGTAARHAAITFHEDASVPSAAARCAALRRARTLHVTLDSAKRKPRSADASADAAPPPRVSMLSSHAFARKRKRRCAAQPP